jgi:UDP:flavonoid glycosyltransferase YjiC (YdhE family)
MVSTNRIEPPVDSAIHSGFARVVEEKKVSGRPIIYVTLSTKDPGDIQFLPQLVKAAQRRTDWLFVITLADRLDPSSLGKLPLNAHVFPWLPQLEVLAHADVSVNHGGIHTINECLLFEVPMLVYSGKRYDQNGCAARVHYHGLGLMGDKDRDAPQTIASKIGHVLSDGEMRKRVGNMRDAFETYVREARLEHTVDQLMKAAKSHPPL